MSNAHDAHGAHDHGHDGGHGPADGHGHGGHDRHAHLSPAEARETIAEFGFYAAFAIAAVAVLLQGFVGNFGAPPAHAPGVVHHEASAHEAPAEHGH